MKRISIENKAINGSEPVFIIAEAGINHNGKLEHAKLLIDEAARVQVSAIKFQTHFLDDEMLKDHQGADYIGESLYELLDRTKLSKDDHRILQSHAKEKNIIFLSTPFSREASDFLDEINVPAFKIGSGELTNLPFLEHVAKKGKPMILSTGMSTLEEIKNTIDFVKPINDQLILMQCTSSYPTRYENVNLRFMEILRNTFDVNVGLSDHSEGIYTALGAVALGAVVVEKHFTIDRNWPGPDQKASIEPKELAELVKGSLAVWKALGEKKIVLEDEIQVQKMARESVVSIKDIKKGETLGYDNLWVKRPGTGIPAKELKNVCGKIAHRDIVANVLLTQEDIA